MSNIFKTTEEILTAQWNDEEIRVELDPSKLEPPPPKQFGVYMPDLKIKDIRLWETLYYKGGSIGIYAAWDPYSEFFLITYNLFLGTSAGIEVFEGPGAIRKVYLKAKELGIDLDVGEIWVESENIKFYDHLS